MSPHKARVMEAGGLRRSFEQQIREELLGDAGKDRILQVAAPLCSFTGLACIDSDDSSNVVFYWIDAGRGLLGRGFVNAASSEPPKPPPTPVAAETNEGKSPSIPRLAGVGGGEGAEKTEWPGLTCKMEVLSKDLKRPLRIAVAPGKFYRHLVFYTQNEEDKAPYGASVCMYDTKTEKTRVLVESLCDVRGLQVTPSLDVLFLARTEATSSEVHLHLIGTKQCLADVQAAIPIMFLPRILALCEKPRFGHATRYEDFALLPNGVVLCAVRVSERGEVDSSATGAVHAYIPDGQLPLCNRKWPTPPPEDPGLRRDRRFDIEDYVRQYEEWWAQHKPPSPPPVEMEEPPEPVPEIVVLPPSRKNSILTHGGGSRKSVDLSKGGTGGARKSTDMGSGPRKSTDMGSGPRKSTDQGTGARKSTDHGTGSRKSTDTGKPGQRSGSQGGGGSKLGLSTVVPLLMRANHARRHSHIKSRRKPGDPMPRIPPLDLTCITSKDPFFSLDAPQPPLTGKRARSLFQPCLSPTCHRPIISLRFSRPLVPRVLLDGLPLIKTLAFSPVSLRVLLGCCGAPSNGLSTSLGEVDLWPCLTQGEGAGFRPLLGGFMVCMGMDGYGHVLLRSARNEGQLLVLWAKGTHAWGKMVLPQAASVPLPITPRETSDKEPQQPASKDEKVGKRVEKDNEKRQREKEKALAKEEQLGGVKPAEDGETREPAGQLAGKAAEWSKDLVASLPNEGKRRTNVHANNTFTDSGRVNTLVVLRVRPLLSEEKAAGVEGCLTCTKNDVSVDGSFLPLKQRKTFTFDRVYDETAKQVDIYNEVVAPVVQRVLQGFSCTCFAYGQTGSGKTFTMEGSMDAGEQAGIIPRCIYHIFDQLAKLPNATYKVKVSHVEIYNEQFHDLLRSDRSTATKAMDESGGEEADKLRIEEGPRRRIRLRGAREIPVRSPHNIFQILHKSIKNRHTAETRCNRHSSRSHGIFTVRLRCRYSHPTDGTVDLEGCLNLVDLSGSENIKRSGAEGLRAREAGTIAQSLLAFSRVITGLVNGGAHIPYRDSKLTHLLADSLGGKSYTTIILAVTPAPAVLDETLNTLSYASLARGVYNKPTQSLLRRDANGRLMQGNEGKAATAAGGPMAMPPPLRPWEGGVPVRRAHAWEHGPRQPNSHVYHCQALDWVASVVLDQGQLSRDATRALTSLFASHDGNGDGLLSLTEVRKLHKAWVPDTLPRHFIDAWTPSAARQSALSRDTLSLSQFLCFALHVAREDPLFSLHIFQTAGYSLSLAPDATPDRPTPVPLYQTPKVADPTKGIRRDDNDEASSEVLDNNHTVGRGGPITSGFVSPLELFDYLTPYVKPVSRHVAPTPVASPGRIKPQALSKQGERKRTLVLPPALSHKPSPSDASMGSLTLASLMDETSLGAETMGFTLMTGSTPSTPVSLPLRRRPLSAPHPHSLDASAHSSTPERTARRTLGHASSLRGDEAMSPAPTPKPYRAAASPSPHQRSGSRGRSISPQKQLFSFTSGLTSPLRATVCEYCSRRVRPGAVHSVAYCQDSP